MSVSIHLINTDQNNQNQQNQQQPSIQNQQRTNTEQPPKISRRESLLKNQAFTTDLPLATELPMERRDIKADIAETIATPHLTSSEPVIVTTASTWTTTATTTTNTWATTTTTNTANIDNSTEGNSDLLPRPQHIRGNDESETEISNDTDNSLPASPDHQNEQKIIEAIRTNNIKTRFQVRSATRFKDS